ncbi:MAG TPA: hypothetical protein DCQ94_09855 [Nitrospira sp.]|nr:hypothetical protein [Nitrospira sp.]
MCVHIYPSTRSGGLDTSYLLLQGAEPRVERLVGIHDNLKFSIRKFADDPGTLGGEGNFHPLAIDAQGIGQVEDPADVLKRDGVE